MDEQALSRDAVYIPLPVLIERLVDLVANFAFTHPGFDLIFGGIWGTEEMTQIVDEMNDSLTQSVGIILVAKAPSLDAERHATCARVMTYIIKGLLPLVASSDPHFRERAIQELKVAGIAYLNTVISDRDQTP
ncbi:MAG: hypothetical protein HC828_09110 [Blastochloris sp.]|nr:hypothetical protein [Blastochloris sp.]